MAIFITQPFQLYGHINHTASVNSKVSISTRPTNKAKAMEVFDTKWFTRKTETIDNQLTKMLTVSDHTRVKEWEQMISFIHPHLQRSVSAGFSI